MRITKCLPLDRIEYSVPVLWQSSINADICLCEELLYSHCPPNVTDSYLDQFMKYSVWHIFFFRKGNVQKYPKLNGPKCVLLQQNLESLQIISKIFKQLTLSKENRFQHHDFSPTDYSGQLWRSRAILKMQCSFQVPYSWREKFRDHSNRGYSQI